MSGQVEIFVRLLDEAVEVWRPVAAERIRDNVYRILDQPYDGSTETWEFHPGAQVLCELVPSSDGRILAATREFVAAGEEPE